MIQIPASLVREILWQVRRDIFQVLDHAEAVRSAVVVDRWITALDEPQSERPDD